jgi:AcrR family transcriptional regulator
MPKIDEGRPLATRGEATRRKIVTAAVRSFSERGFEAASTREIAERAGVDQGLLTYHFPNKDLLWRASADQIFETLGRGLESRVAKVEDTDPGERSRAVIREYVRTMAAHPEFFRFIVDQGGRSDQRTRWLVDTHIKPRFQIVKQLGLARAAGVEDADLPHAFFALLGAASLIFAVAPNCRRLTGLNPKSKDVIEAHAEFVANLMAPLGRPLSPQSD